MIKEKEKRKSIQIPYQMWRALKKAATANERTIAEEIAAQIQH